MLGAGVFAKVVDNPIFSQVTVPRHTINQNERYGRTFDAGIAARL